MRRGWRGREEDEGARGGGTREARGPALDQPRAPNHGLGSRRLGPPSRRVGRRRPSGSRRPRPGPPLTWPRDSRPPARTRRRGKGLAGGRVDQSRAARRGGPSALGAPWPVDVGGDPPLRALGAREGDAPNPDVERLKSLSPPIAPSLHPQARDRSTSVHPLRRPPSCPPGDRRRGGRRWSRTLGSSDDARAAVGRTQAQRDPGRSRHQPRRPDVAATPGPWVRTSSSACSLRLPASLSPRLYLRVSPGRSFVVTPSHARRSAHPCAPGGSHTLEGESLQGRGGGGGRLGGGPKKGLGGGPVRTGLVRTPRT